MGKKIRLMKINLSNLSFRKRLILGQGTLYYFILSNSVLREKLLMCPCNPNQRSDPNNFSCLLIFIFKRLGLHTDGENNCVDALLYSLIIATAVENK